MDLYKAIRELVEERKRIERIIASLEAMLERGSVASKAKAVSKLAEPARRGRKSMSAEERKQVSERMARYWAARRNQKQEGQAQEEPPPDVQAGGR